MLDPVLEDHLASGLLCALYKTVIFYKNKLGGGGGWGVFAWTVKMKLPGMQVTSPIGCKRVQVCISCLARKHYILEDDLG